MERHKYIKKIFIEESLQPFSGQNLCTVHLVMETCSGLPEHSKMAVRSAHQHWACRTATKYIGGRQHTYPHLCLRTGGEQRMSSQSLIPNSITLVFKQDRLNSLLSTKQSARSQHLFSSAIGIVWQNVQTHQAGTLPELELDDGGGGCGACTFSTSST